MIVASELMKIIIEILCCIKFQDVEISFLRRVIKIFIVLLQFLNGGFISKPVKWVVVAI